MGVNSITFNGRNSLDFGLYVSGNGVFSSAEKEYTTVSVPGRNGDLLLYENRYKNVTVSYPAIIIPNRAFFSEEALFEKNCRDIRSWLMSSNGYCRLEDSYHPEEFRIASFSGPVSISSALRKAGTVTLSFNCKPQRWLKIGEIPKHCSYGSTISLTNETDFDAKPLIRIIGEGTVVAGNSRITVADPPGTSDFIDVDCDICDCFEGAVNRNPYVTVTSWPVIKAGETMTFSLGTGITDIYVTPRWWII